MQIDRRTVTRVLRTAQRLWRRYASQQPETTRSSSSRRGSGAVAAPSEHRAGNTGAYPGDYAGALDAVYGPRPDGRPDPGEIVWTWVPYEEDHRRGKDRPVLLVGRDGRWLLGLMLTSKDHTNAAHRDDRYLDIGSGPWDRQGRASEILVDRVIRVDPGTVRREGAVLPREVFERVVRAVPRRR
ncbi:type II toxin-antitoxin system PemK/MazF family toxin [Rothia kristinae]|uniref:type II toxin-antitoxin system PemK/MazF family toxin n=1 Tax=Rothia kristinae TaxID=37923 RepID=UPI000C2591EB|nr:type II toxin-antitoxin system PemK/MazF family toxin [Rothia kristinae]TDP57109.1 PemK-like, MazF-like toxin of type II toxin-antitoxin system [Kocuria sp. AG109]MCA1168964.1 type II toxin-antitoxin system PemK/MazF family toxin [Rothia kristinae]MCT1356975.1 type II toxin-antitoxin system PemK/MazF family toxin [Rothia kristinae]MCT1393260.1 type II toxin-antitoxin system PemK/MazF family toxin [Rothia kristinae]MCT1505370.1 type II toxin-antitoxin system PemK/MazF family toxin [Rothia kr